MTTDAWLKDRLVYLRGLKKPSEAQQLLMLLASEPEPLTDAQRRMMAVLIRAEKADEQAQKARIAVRRALNR